MKLKKILIIVGIILIVLLLLSIVNKNNTQDKKSEKDKETDKLSVSHSDLNNLDSKINSLDIEDLAGFDG